MQQVARFSDVYQAEVAASFLAAHGLHAVVAERALATMQPLLQTALGGVRVLTPAHEAEAALDLLARVAAGEFEDEAAETSKAPEPRLGGLFRIITATTALLLGSGYAGRAYVGARPGLSALQLFGIVLLGGFAVAWVLLAVAALAGRG